MKRTFGLLQLSLLLFATTLAHGQEAVQVSIIYDNYQVDKSLKTDWGFACLVEYEGHKLLFDAGRNAELYKKNMGIMDIRPGEIPSVYISHEHGDHTAGLPWISESNPSVNCYLPTGYAAQLKASGKLPPNSKNFAEATHLYGPFYSTGDHFQKFEEQGLIVKTKNGGILIIGCGHPGPLEMIKKVEAELGIQVYALLGGLHLMRHSNEEVEKIASALKDSGIRHICPTHCTGDQSISYLAEAFGEAYISGGTGKIITLK